MQSNQNPGTLFCGYQQTDSKVYMERQKLLNSQLNIEGERQSGRTDPAQLQDLMQSYSHPDTVWCQQKDRQTDEWDRIKSPETNPHTHSPWVSDKEAKEMQWRQSFQQMMLEQLDTHIQKKESRHRPYIFHKKKTQNGSQT